MTMVVAIVLPTKYETARYCLIKTNVLKGNGRSANLKICKSAPLALNQPINTKSFIESLLRTLFSDSNC